MPKNSTSVAPYRLPDPRVEQPRRGDPGTQVASLARAAVALQAGDAGRPAAEVIFRSIPGVTRTVIPSADRVALITCTRSGILHAVEPVEGDVVRRLLAVEELGAGPCTLAAATGEQVTVGDVRQDLRWPQWSPAVAHLGLIGVCATPVPGPGSQRSVLLLASGRIIDQDTAALAQAWSMHVGMALAAARNRDDLEAALASRDMIGQAKGIVMERFKLTSEEAFTVLVKASTDTNTKLRTVCNELCLTGELAQLKRR